MTENPEIMLGCHLRTQSSKALGYMLSFKHGINPTEVKLCWIWDIFF